MLAFIFVVMIVVIGLLMYRQSYRMRASKQLRIMSSEGIDETRLVKINGIKQFVYIRGQHQDNPMILFLHGGPGSPMTPMIYKYQQGLESDYTVVNWEQRNAGKTYFLNKEREAEIKETLCIEQYVEDIYELVLYLKQEFHQEIVIMGHSWGSTIGALFVKKYTQMVKAYIGIGQNLSINAGEKLIFEEALKIMPDKEKQNYLKLVKEEQRIQFGHEQFDVKVFAKHRQLSGKYLMPDVVSDRELVKTTLLSPLYSLKDIRWFLMNNLKLQSSLLAELGSFDLRIGELDYEVPMIFIMGDKDWVTPYPLVEKYYEEIKAPFKELIFIQNAGHCPMLDQPDYFCEQVLNALKPILS